MSLEARHWLAAIEAGAAAVAAGRAAGACAWETVVVTSIAQPRNTPKTLLLIMSDLLHGGFDAFQRNICLLVPVVMGVGPPERRGGTNRIAKD